MILMILLCSYLHYLCSDLKKKDSMSNVWECSVATFYNKLLYNLLSRLKEYGTSSKKNNMVQYSSLWYNCANILTTQRGAPEGMQSLFRNTWGVSTQHRKIKENIFVFFKINKGTVSDITLQASWYDIKLWLDSYSIKQDSTFKRSVHMKSKTHPWIPRHNSLNQFLIQSLVILKKKQKYFVLKWLISISF